MRLIISGLSEINFKLMGFKFKPSFSKLFELIFIHYPKYIVYCTPVVYSLRVKNAEYTIIALSTMSFGKWNLSHSVA